MPLGSVRKPYASWCFHMEWSKIIYLSLLTFEVGIEDELLVVSVWCLSLNRAQ